MAKLAKPRFADIAAAYKLPSTSVHECRLLDPTHAETSNTCAARLSEALVIAVNLVPNREAIAALGREQGTGRGRGTGAGFLLGNFGYLGYGLLCPHGIARGAQQLGAFLAHSWGGRNTGWPAQPHRTAAPADIQGRKGLILYARIPTYSGEGHIDLWNGAGPVGQQYWDAHTIWFWDLA
ncbi:MAG: T6SS effector amidase Tae4 family protein [Byssovorax sp.]